MQTAFKFDAESAVVVDASLTRVVWQSGDRIIAKASSPELGVFSVLGEMVNPVIGGQYQFRGKWTKNDRFLSMDLRFDSYRTVLPDSPNGVVRYLAMQAKFVGPAVAARIVETFGEDTMKILKEDPKRVAREIPGITPDRAEEIALCLRLGEEHELAFLQVSTLVGDAVSSSTVSKAVRRWGARAAEKIKADPFILMDLPGIGFARADDVFKKLGGLATDPRRNAVAIECALEEQIMQSGSTLVVPQKVKVAASAMLGCGSPDTLLAFENAYAASAGSGLLVSQLGGIGLDRFFAAEAFIARWFADRMSLKLCEPLPDPKDRASQTLVRFPIPVDGLAADQCAAAVAFEDAATFVLCGSPGTGKTYTVARIVKAALAAGGSVALAAPTGKAAKQMRKAMQATCPGVSPQTIHSLLAAQMDDDTGRFVFTVDESNQLSYDLLVIDETSMLDVSLARSLLRAVTPRTRVLFVGDPHQLPSVGPGAVLRDILAAGFPPSFELREIKRNAGTIVRACHAFKAGTMHPADVKFDESAGANWRHFECHEPFEIAEIIEALLRSKLAAAGFDPFTDSQIISPTNTKTDLSCDALNVKAKAILNPVAPEGKLSFAVGDRVIQLSNKSTKGKVIPEGSSNDAALAALDALSCRPAPVGGETDETAEDPDADRRRAEGEGRLKADRPAKAEVFVVNGDIGHVLRIDKSVVCVKFYDPCRVVALQRRELDLRLAYCVTCHKMQGSEAPVVILPVHRSIFGMPMVTREWLYTAFSRAKRMIVTVGDSSQLPVPLRRCGNAQRVTSLRSMIEDAINTGAAAAENPGLECRGLAL